MNRTTKIEKIVDFPLEELIKVCLTNRDIQL
jgi:hypothetical protein